MLTVVIPAFNEEDYIAKCLESLVHQDVKEPFEVIVVDNGSTDKTAQIAEGYFPRLDIKVVQEKQKGRGVARKTGFAAARGEIIFSTDADAILPKHWIRSLTERIRKDPKTVAVTTPAEIHDLSQWTNRLFNFIAPKTIPLNYLLFRTIGLGGFSFAVRKKSYNQVGGFNEDLDAYEDLDLGCRLAKIGHIAFLYRIRVTFSGRRFKNGFVKGWLEYLQTWFTKYLFKKEKVVLSDQR